MVELLTDPDQLNRDTEVTLSTGTDPKTFALNNAGNLAGKKVPGNIFYSWFIDETDSARSPELLRFARPFDLIDGTTIEFTEWEPADDATRLRLAQLGWSELDAATNIKQSWLCIEAKGSVNADTPAYYVFDDEAVAHDFSTNGLPQEGIKFFGDATHGDVDWKSSRLRIRYRRSGYELAEAEIGELYKLPLVIKNYIVTLTSNVDTKLVTTNDLDIDANSDGVADVAPYATPTLKIFPEEPTVKNTFAAYADATVYAPGTIVSSGATLYQTALGGTSDGDTLDEDVGVTDWTEWEVWGFPAWADGLWLPPGAVVSDGGRWFQTLTGGVTNGTDHTDDTGVTDWASWGEKAVAGTYYPFQYIVANSNSCDRYELHTLQHFWCRQTEIVDLASDTPSVVGRVLKQLFKWSGDTLVTQRSVAIEDPQATDVNALLQTDATGTPRAEDFLSAITMNFNPTIQNDPEARYVLVGAFNTASAYVVEDALGNPITGLVSGQSSVVASYNWNGNTQGGRTPATPVDVWLVTIGRGGSGWAEAATATIIQGSVSVSSSSARDRVYTNPNP